MVSYRYVAAILFVGYMQQAIAMTTTTAPMMNHTHGHHESPEMDNVSFVYDGTTQMLLVHTGSKCYIWSLTHKELNMVHTDDGLRQIELRVLNEIDDSFYTVVDKHILANSILRSCGSHVTGYYVVH